MNILQELQSYDTKTPLAMVIRHADRNKIPKGEFGNDVLLNELGERNAFAFGQSLRPYPIKRILTSPVPRCVQTAEFIAQGYGQELAIEQTKMLGDPGCHVYDAEAAGKHYLKVGFFKIMDEFVQGIDSPGLRPQQDYKEVMTEFIRQNTAADGLTLFVTHDGLIALYRYVMQNYLYTPESWVPYIGGFTFNPHRHEA